MREAQGGLVGDPGTESCSASLPERLASETARGTRGAGISGRTGERPGAPGPNLLIPRGRVYKPTSLRKSRDRATLEQVPPGASTSCAPTNSSLEETRVFQPDGIQECNSP